MHTLYVRDEFKSSEVTVMPPPVIHIPLLGRTRKPPRNSPRITTATSARKPTNEKELQAIALDRTPEKLHIRPPRKAYRAALFCLSIFYTLILSFKRWCMAMMESL